MASEGRTKEILKELYDAVVHYDEDKAAEWAGIALTEDVDPLVASLDGLANGMVQVGELYSKKEYYVPELLMCADALNAGMNILKPALKASGRKSAVKGSIVLGVVEGDVHDIGKNLVKVMFEAAGWNVHDLGRDVPLDKFVEELVETKCDVVGISALMTTSIQAIPELVKKLKEKNPNVRIMLGGAPLNPEIVEKYGADGYAKDASSAVEEAVKLIKMLKEEALG